ncbi:MAG: type I restriction endonuclease subunit R [SAR324 cluster bacterium]|nr:type I restriction endonuclease subunit R [SAR324 cluster bacterium]
MSGIYTEKKFEEDIEKVFLKGGYLKVSPKDYDKNLCLIPEQLIEFIKKTQPKEYEKLTVQYGDNINNKLLTRISEQIGSRGVIDVLHKGIADRGANFELVYFQPKSGLNPEHKDLYKNNHFAVVRQLAYSTKNNNTIDMGIFINGVPVALLELKNSLTGQTHIDGITQWKNNRDVKEKLFEFKRNIVYFAVGNEKVYMATRLDGSNTKFLPFNKDIDNPINPAGGSKTHYLWDDILQKDSLLDLIENFVHIKENVKTIDKHTQQKPIKEKSETLIFPRFHQLNVIRRLKRDILGKGAGVNYLIQHSTGSGKSLSIGWLSHMLSSLFQNQTDTNRIFDSIIVVTDRRILDKQIQDTILQLEKTKGVVNAVDKTSQQLKEFLESGKTIIISTIQKFPVISKTIASLGHKKFGVIIDEAHSSQGGERSKSLNGSLSDLKDHQEGDGTEDLTLVDKKVSDEIARRVKQTHISQFAFSGTPTSKTLEVFGEQMEKGFKAFDIYSMKQSIAEGFTLDVLQNYTTYKRYFKLNNRVKEDKELPESRAKLMLVKWVDLHHDTITEKVRIILEHFVEHTSKKIAGKGRAMLVTRSRLHCVKYKLEFDRQMKVKGLGYKALVGFSGTVKDSDTQQEYTEHSMNGISEAQTATSFKKPDFRLLIVNNKFQTGFDEPMLHTMYIDKRLGGLQCVQTLSRLNRTMAGKTDAFVLDFVNDPPVIQGAFQSFYESTMLEEETDPNMLYNVKAIIDGYDLFGDSEVKSYADIFYSDDIPSEKLQGVLDAVVKKWSNLEREEQKSYRGHIYKYIKLYGYISQIITFKDIELEKLFVFLQGLNKKLPKISGDKVTDFLSAINLDSLKIEKKHTFQLKLEDGDKFVDGISIEEVVDGAEEPKAWLSYIINKLNDSFSDDTNDRDKAEIEEIYSKLKADGSLKDVMKAKNTDAGKRSSFYDKYDKAITSIITDNEALYNKMIDPKMNAFIKEKMYNHYVK